MNNGGRMQTEPGYPETLFPFQNLGACLCSTPSGNPVIQHRRPLFFWNLSAVSSLKQSPSFWLSTVSSTGNEYPV